MLESVEIASILVIALFSITTLLGLFGLIFKAKNSSNPYFFYTFYSLIIAVSGLQLSMGAINFLPQNSNKLPLFLDQLLNLFSLVGQLGLLQTVSYSWAVLSAKLKEEYEMQRSYLDRQRRAFLIWSAVLLILYCFLTAGILLAYILYDDTMPNLLAASQLLIYCMMLAGCFLQLHSGRILAELLTKYQYAIGLQISRARFNAVFIGAFAVTLLRTLVEMARLVYYIVVGFTPNGFWSSLYYYAIYTVIYVIPISLYLIGIRVEKKNEEESMLRRMSTIRYSLYSRSSVYSSARRYTELVSHRGQSNMG